MNDDTPALCLEILFWFALFVVFYTYLGYGSCFTSLSS